MNTAACKGCAAPIIWCRSLKTGSKIPVDAKATEPTPRDLPHTYAFTGEMCKLDPSLYLIVGIGHISSHFGYVSHFRTCPEVGKFSKQKGPR